MQVEKRAKKSWVKIRTLLYFLGALTLVYLFIPRTQRLHYEVQRGKVWTHATVKAPYDFPIYKKPETYAKERRTILESVKPIFREDTTVVRLVTPKVVQLAKLECIKWRDSLSAKHPPSQTLSTNATLSSERIERLEGVLQYLYKVGILESASLLKIAATSEFSVLRGPIAYETSLENVYTPKLATAFIAQEMAKSLDDSIAQSLWFQFDPIPLLEQNLLYDSALTQRLREEKLANLSKTRGVVRMGEKIIEKGDVVTEEAYVRLTSLQREMNTRHRTGVWIWINEIGYIILLSVAFVMLYLFLRKNSPQILTHNKQILFTLLLTTTTIVSAFLIIQHLPMALYVVPFAIVPLLTRTFLNSRLAFALLLISVCVVGFFAPDSYRFTLINLVAGSIPVFTVTKIYRRGGLFQTVGLILLAYLLMYITITTIQDASIKAVNPYTLSLFAVNALLILASYQLMYPMERIFGFISNATLMELCDFNQRLLRELAEKAPGTFQHSMQVANLAEAAAAEIDGNPLLARTGALYHDIGKINHPEYFVENQELGINPHKTLTEIESAEIIIRHVADGVKIAHKHNLPEQIIDFIKTHHGTTRTEYFYRTYLKKHPDAINSGEQFQYPGPKPHSKETAILMMADSVEAASRSLKSFTKETLRELVDAIITSQQVKYQFSNADITFRQITTIKEVFCRKLENFYHTRIEYPEEPKTPS